MDPRHHEALCLHLEGKTAPQIAEVLGIHRQTAWEWLQRKDVQARILEVQEEAKQDAAKRLRYLATKAVDRLAKIVDSEAEDQARMAAVAILDRAGLGPTQKHEVEHETTMELVVNGERMAMPDSAPPPPQLPEPTDDQ